MRTISPTESQYPIHPMFVPYALDLDAQVESRGRFAAMCLCLETVRAIARLIEAIATDECAEFNAIMERADVTLEDLIQAAEYFGDRCEALSNSKLN